MIQGFILILYKTNPTYHVKFNNAFEGLKKFDKMYNSYNQSVINEIHLFLIDKNVPFI